MVIDTLVHTAEYTGGDIEVVGIVEVGTDIAVETEIGTELGIVAQWEQIAEPRPDEEGTRMLARA